MNLRNSNRPPDDWMDDRVEAYVDGMLPDDEAARFEAALEEAPRWKRQVRHAKRIHATLATQTMPACPPECTEAILNQTVRAHASAPAADAPAEPAPAAASEPASRPDESAARSWMDQIANALHVLTQPAYSTALAAVLVAVIAWMAADPSVSLPGRDAPATESHIEAPYSEDDVAQAHAEAELVLSYISDASQDASNTAEREMERALSPFFDARPAASSTNP